MVEWVETVEMRPASRYLPIGSSPTVHPHCHFGIRHQKTIPVMVFNGSVYGPSGLRKARVTFSTVTSEHIRTRLALESL